MIFRLILLFTVIPLIELILLIKIGQQIGLGATLAIVILTGIIGAYLAREQGFITISRIRQEIQNGQIPADPLLDGVLILAGGLLLITPGLLTDAAGFSVLIPYTRKIIKAYIKELIRRHIDTGRVYTSYKID